jgi:glycosyltransferase involved in cell wall biosynthesis
MTKIVHLITGLGIGGAELMLYKLLSHMQGPFQHMVVSMVAPGSVGARIAALGIPVVSLEMPAGRPTPGGLGALWALLRRERPAILQTWMYHANLLGLIAGRLAGVPHIVWNIRNADVRGFPRSTRVVIRLGAWLSHGPRVIICNAHAARAELTALGYHPRRWAIVPNGFDTDRYKPDPAVRATLRAAWGVPDDAPLIGLIARYDPLKDHAGFVRAAALLARCRPDAHFVLAGPGITPDNSALAGPIRAAGLGPVLHLLGPRDDVPQIMAALDIHTSASAYGEGFSNATGEAMACGVPCVVTDVGDSARVVGDTGIVVPPRRPAALVAAWQTLIACGPAGRAARGRAARARIAGHYSIERVAHQYEALYSALPRKTA